MNCDRKLKRSSTIMNISCIQRYVVIHICLHFTKKCESVWQNNCSLFKVHSNKGKKCFNFHLQEMPYSKIHNWCMKRVYSIEMKPLLTKPVFDTSFPVVHKFRFNIICTHFMRITYIVGYELKQCCFFTTMTTTTANR